ncbi:tetratricopeptide repeat protein [Paraburkholderia bonniea]|uniref:tetratricopeptide repeat protein n=1 Tax=Paraburkholderia bonniea TaxID=2152891 RepID=UPI001291D934|nr:tetratricopeptide repeat protein [Paraburkholderia bonniea]
MQTIQPTPEASTEALFSAAFKAHQDGAHALAATLYQQTLAQAPSHTDALHYYGVLEHQRGAHQAAATLLDQALRLNPLGAECFSNRGLVACALNDPDTALHCYHAALALRPDYADAHNNLGILLQNRQQTDAALDHYRQALSFEPSHTSAWHNLGQALTRLKRYDEAQHCYKALLALAPKAAESHFGYGNMLKAKGDTEAAIASFQRAIELQPGFTQALVNLGTVLGHQGAYHEAEQHYRQAIALDPSPAHLVCLGAVRGMLGAHDDEEALYHQALAIEPEQPDARQNLAWLYLKRGDYRQGWREYAKRWRPCDYSDISAEGIPKWEGEPLAGRRLLIAGEQGFGDHFQFLRYARLLEQRGAQVDACVREPLLEIARSVPGLTRVWSDIPQDGNHYDFWVRLMDIPSYVGTELSTIPAEVPYLFTDPVKIAAWKPRVEAAAQHKRCKVGLVWRGSDKGVPSRMMTLSAFEPLLANTQVAWFSLQKGPAQAQIDTLPASLRPIDFSADLHNFSDTAALIMNLDLVLAIDTGVAHLAGALGKPVWVLLPVGADWRWLEHRSDSPWYPTARLFRQTTHADWQTVTTEVGTALQTMLDEQAT